MRKLDPEVIDTISNDQNRQKYNSYYEDVKEQGYLFEEDRREQIDRENTVLLEKLNKIMDKKPEVHTVYSIKSKLPKHLQDFGIKDKPHITETRSSYSHDRAVPAWLNQRLSVKLRAKPTKPVVLLPEEQDIPRNPAKESFDSTMKFLQALRQQSSMRQQKELEDRFNKPEELYERVVLYKKSCIFEDTSYLVEISAAYGKLIVLVYDMMNPKFIRRLVLSEQRTAKLLNQCDYDYHQLASQVVISDEGVTLTRRHFDKSNPSDSQYLNSELSANMKKMLFERQIEFIERNFYQEMQKRKKKIGSSMEMTGAQQSQHTTIHKMDESYQQKPASALSNIRKKFQIEPFNKHRKLINGCHLKGNGNNSEIVREGRTENYIGRNGNIRDKNINNRHKGIKNIEIAKNQQKNKVNVQNGIQLLNKGYIKGILTNERYKQKQIKKSHQNNGVFSFEEPLSQMIPTKLASKENKDDIDEYDQNFDGQQQHSSEDHYQFEVDADYPEDKPASRLKHQRDKDGVNNESQDRSSSDLQEKQSSDENIDSNIHINRVQQAAYEQQWPEEQPAYEDEEAFDGDNLVLSENNQKQLLQDQPAEVYEEDFDISQSKA